MLATLLRHLPSLRTKPALAGTCFPACPTLAKILFPPTTPPSLKPPRAAFFYRPTGVLTNEGTHHNDGCTPARQPDCSRKSLASPVAPVCSRWPFLTTLPVSPYPSPPPPPLREIQPPPALARSRRPIWRAPAPLRDCRKMRHHHDRAFVYAPNGPRLGAPQLHN